MEDERDVTGPALEWNVCSDVAKQTLPDVPVSIHKAGYDDHAGRVDDFCAVCRQLRSHRHNSVAFDQDVAGREIADLWIETQNGSAFDEHSVDRGHGEVDPARIEHG